jgi:hypothetical protein
LLAAHVRRLTGAGVAGLPAARVVVEHGRDAGPGRARDSGPGDGERPRDRVVAGARAAGLPDVVQLGGRGQAEALPPGRQPLGAGRRGREQHHAGDGRQRDPPPAPRLDAQRGEQRPHRRVPLRRLGGQASQQQAAQEPGHPAPMGGLAHGAAGHRLGQRQQRIGGERALAVQGLVEGDAEAELIGARVRRAREKLLGRHVERRTQQLAGRGQRGAVRGERRVRRRRDGGSAPAVRGDVVRQPEVHHPHGAVARHHHVLGLEVAVHEAGVVGGREPVPRRRERVANLAPPARRRRQPGGQRRSFDELHRHEHPTVDRAGVVDDHDAGMGEARDRLGLAQQAVAAGLGAGALRRVVQKLERDLAIELRIVGGVDLPHAAATDQVQDHVAPDGAAAGQRGRARRGRSDVGSGRRRHQLRARGAVGQVALRRLPRAGGQRPVDQRQHGILVEAAQDALASA